ncbi:hypothetical protein AAVH_24967 [Aphelenchoides avenae]|nr:hypothetical protein AAVH_24967 [Aphelenchus avenae]
MKKKFRRRPWKELAPKPPTIKRRKLPIEQRKQLLSEDSLVDVFGWSKRTHMDQWHTLSHQFNIAALRAKPLRSVEDIKFAYHKDKNTHTVTFTRSELKFKSNAKKRTWVSIKGRTMTGHVENRVPRCQYTRDGGFDHWA